MQPSFSKSTPVPPGPQPSDRRRNSFNVLFFGYLGLLLLLAQGFVFTPLYILHIGATLYGSWLGLTNALSWVGAVDPGLYRICSVRIGLGAGRGDSNEISDAFIEGMLAAIPLSLCPLALLLLSVLPMDFLALPSVEKAQLTEAARWTLVSLAVGILTGPVVATVRGLQITVLQGLVGLFTALLGMGVTAYLLLVLNWGLVSLPLGALARSGADLLLNALILAFRPEIAWRRFRWPSGSSFLSSLKGYRAGYVLVFGGALRNQVSYLLTAVWIAPEAATVLAITNYAFLLLNQVVDRTLQAPMSSLAHLAGTGNRARVREIVLAIRSYCGFLAFVGVGSIIALNFAFVSLWVKNSLFGGFFLSLWIGMEVFQTLSVHVYAESFFSVGAIPALARVRFWEGALKAAFQTGFCFVLGLVGLPIGSLLSSFVIRLGFLAKLESRVLGMSRFEIRKAFFAEVLQIAAAVGLGALGYLVARHFAVQQNWGTFFAAAAVTGCVFSLLGLVFFDPVRRLVWDRWIGANR